MSDGRRLIPEALNVTHTWVDIRLLSGIKTPRKGLFSVQLLNFSSKNRRIERIP